MFNYLVVGAGLMGSATLRYLSAQSDGVAVIGSAEPADWSTHNGVFASHYDNGRLCSMFGTDAVWTKIHRMSLGQYSTIEAKSGVTFHTPSGRFNITKDGGKKIGEYDSNSNGLIRTYTAETFPKELPISIPADRTVYWEDAPSGYINPRGLVEAQLTIAAQQGAEIIRATVTDIQDQGSHVDVITSDGQTYSAKKVVLATGSFTNHLNLLPRKVAIRTKSETTILAEVPESEAERFKQLPGVGYDIDDPELHGIYLVPPLLYPDGNYYLKMGFDTPSDLLNPSLEAIQGWFAGENIDAHKAAARRAVETLFPDLQVTAWHMKPCIVCYTPSGKPIIDALVPSRIYLVAAGNGTGAGPSDGIGRIAADLVINDRWMENFDHEPFQARYMDEACDWYEAPLTIFPR